MKYGIQFFNILFCFAGLTSCSAAQSEEVVKSTQLWQFISESEMPKNSVSESDAFLVKYIRYQEKNSSSEEYILMEAWENGWNFYIWKNQKWISISTANEVWYEGFAIGYFNPDNFLDILLYDARGEDTFTDQSFPPMPRLFLGNNKKNFIPSSLSCSIALHGLASSNFTIYKNKHVNEATPDFLKSFISTEEKKLNEVCEFME